MFRLGTRVNSWLSGLYGTGDGDTSAADLQHGNAIGTRYDPDSCSDPEHD